MSPKLKELVLGPMETSEKSENHANDDVSGLPEVKSKSY